MTHTKSGKRPWLGALLAFLLPGLGHVYLREWLRSMMWFAFVVSAVLLFVPIPDSAMATAESGSMETAWTAAMEATEDLPLEALLPVFVVRIFSAIDAYWIALRNRGVSDGGDGEEGADCPACGRSVDEDLDFCQWCTTPLSGDDEATEAATDEKPL
ncbi:zinc ribbon domain-containing protein [Halorussus amylolyticus]|uniref:zinc ribbon domain-containing protein n=1 Tax=Halorussus amylolyticus TaxID=1126242 RepID=UPI0010439099|nr:zinc ribbon domain-containing protein [Halorussus amylolyticus]